MLNFLIFIIASRYTLEVRQILQKWYSEQEVLDKSTIDKLVKTTDLTDKQLTKWVYNQKQSINNKSNNSNRFTVDNLIFLKSFFQKNTHPGPNELQEISNQIGFDEKKIRNWFYQQRFKMNHS